MPELPRELRPLRRSPDRRALGATGQRIQLAVRSVCDATRQSDAHPRRRQGGG